ncbi:MAG: hypothetical protein IIY27_03055 [Aeriscardovia sp.]|nr:hypothetical protein [Aeriscardovia sp.]
MEPELTEKQIKEIRVLRRKAIRRRQVIVLCLIVVILIIFFCALGLHFSVAYTLIPIFILAAVVVLGIRASRKAMAWEKKISESSKKPKQEKTPKFDSDDEAPTFILPAQQAGEVQFSLGPADSGIKSLDLRAFDQAGSSGRPEKENDLEKADLI